MIEAIQGGDKGGWGLKLEGIACGHSGKRENCKANQKGWMGKWKIEKEHSRLNISGHNLHR